MMSMPDFKEKQIIFALLSYGDKLSFKNDNIVIKDENEKDSKNNSEDDSENNQEKKPKNNSNKDTEENQKKDLNKNKKQSNNHNFRC